MSPIHCTIVILPHLFSKFNLSLILRSQIKIYFKILWVYMFPSAPFTLLFFKYLRENADLFISNSCKIKKLHNLKNISLDSLIVLKILNAQPLCLECQTNKRINRIKRQLQFYGNSEILELCLVYLTMDN